MQLTVYFYSFHTYVDGLLRHDIFYTFHPTLSLHIYIARAEYFLIPHDAADRQKLGFWIFLFKQQFKASLEQFLYFFNYAAEGQHEQIIDF